MALEATENRIADAILTALQAIGSAPTSFWSTSPLPASRGIPNDALVPNAKPMIFLQHLGTEPQDAESGTATHRARATFAVWCVSSDFTAGERITLNLKADVLRAIFAVENTILTVAAYGGWPSGYTVHEDMAPAGFWCGQQLIYFDFNMTHTDP